MFQRARVQTGVFQKPVFNEPVFKMSVFKMSVFKKSVFKKPGTFLLGGGEGGDPMHANGTSQLIQPLHILMCTHFCTLFQPDPPGGGAEGDPASGGGGRPLHRHQGGLTTQGAQAHQHRHPPRHHTHQVVTHLCL